MDSQTAHLGDKPGVAHFRRFKFKARNAVQHPLARAGGESVAGDGQIARDSARAPIIPPLGGSGPAGCAVAVVVPLSVRTPTAALRKGLSRPLTSGMFGQAKGFGAAALHAYALRPVRSNRIQEDSRRFPRDTFRPSVVGP